MGKPILPIQTEGTPQTQRSSRWSSKLVKLGVFVGLVYYLGTSSWLRKACHTHENHQWAHSWVNSGSKHPHLWGKKAEELFLTVPDPESAIATSRLLATKPHLAGSPGDLDTAKDFLAIFQQEFSITPPAEDPIFAAGSSESQHATHSITKVHKPQAWIDTYYPVMNTPLERSLQVLAAEGRGVLWDADLVEAADETDPEAGRYMDAVPTFHGLSPEGDVEGPVVNGHYCRKEDYDALVAQGVDLTGTIVLCRYGGIFRGLKVKGGQDLGAVGVLIYSDPRDDGTVTVENGYTAYPDGPARNPTSVQRGSVQFLSVYPGDPTTPGYPSYENSTRTEGTNIPTIPSLPISWANAEVLLNSLSEGGRWAGGTVRLLNKVDTKVTPIWNTMGVIPGLIKDEVVVVGNHRDAWVMGATDPTSGTVSVAEVVRGLGALYREGWRPLRTIVIATWDAEEYGLIGSTEWGEDFADWIQENVVAYLNLDSSVSGPRFGVGGSPLLSHFLKTTAEDTPHPTEENKSIWDARQDGGTLFGNRTDGVIIFDKEVAAIRELEISAADSVGVSPLGSGSDYTVFLQRLGIPSTNEGFGSTLNDPVYHYHSVYDSERWQELYADPGFHRHVAVAKHLGLLTLRLSSAVVLPFNTTHYAYELENYLSLVESIALDKGPELNLNPLRKSIYKLQKVSHKLDKEKVEAEQELKKVIKQYSGYIHRFRHVVKEILKRIFKHKDDDELEALVDSKWPWPLKKLAKAVKRVRSVNKKLTSFERGLISEDGIKDREWYKHLGVAPGKWLGYGATTLPGLTEALTYDNDVKLARHEAKRIKDLIDDLTDDIEPDD
ncbi:Zn-dependent exopeptidase [Pluteus cervinus]|uniref:Zn-dependent exopeptidase n=1 Tax=Pluteus cervinus TaxID=181527 RepID=A0ACD3B2C0_9AGAR|nr:Zn-dependent exopeptidase [Pluteus cervinus]